MSGRQTGRGIQKPHSCDFARRGHHIRSFSCPSRATYGRKLNTLRKAHQESRVLFLYRSCIGASGVRLMRPRAIGRRGGDVRPSISSSSGWHRPHACTLISSSSSAGTGSGRWSDCNGVGLSVNSRTLFEEGPDFGDGLLHALAVQGIPGEILLVGQAPDQVLRCLPRRFP